MENKDSLFTDQDNAEIEAAMNQTPEQLAAGLKYLERNKDGEWFWESDWIESRVNELEVQAQKTMTIEKLTLVKTNVAHFINDLNRLKFQILRSNNHSDLRKEEGSKRVDFCLQEMTGIKQLIKERIKYLKVKSVEKEPPKTLSQYLDIKDLENPYPRIFPDSICCKFFERWMNESGENIKADLCFIYWKMIQDKKMFQITPSEYVQWLKDTMKIEFKGYWKQLYRVDTKGRKLRYIEYTK